MSKQHRTQLYLPQDQILMLRERARAAHTTVSDLVRKAVDAYLIPDRPGDLTADPIDALVGAIDAGPADLSSRVDDYLYGPKAPPVPAGRGKRPS